MSENTINLINAIQAGDAVELESAFNSAMAEKVAERLDAMRDTVAQNMFKTAEPVVEEGVQADIDALELTEELMAELAEKYEGFEKLSGELAAKGAKDPKALAAWIGRKKYGKAKFQKAAAADKKLG